MATTAISRRSAAGSRALHAKAAKQLVNPYLVVSTARQLELESLDRQIKKATSSKSEAIASLKRAGIMDRHGKLAKVYRPVG